MHPVPRPPSSPYYSKPARDERDYEEIYYHFDDYAQDIILANADKFLDPPEPAENFVWEDRILDEASEGEFQGIKRSLYFGLGCGLASFALMRRFLRGGTAPSTGFFERYASRSSTGSTGGYRFDPIPQRQQLRPPLPSSSGKGAFIFDLLVSTFVAGGVSVLAVESDMFYPTIVINKSGPQGAETTVISPPPPPQWISSEIPLVPGRSIVAETLCQPLTDEFRKFPKNLWKTDRTNTTNGYDGHVALYANSGWRGSKYYDQNSNATVENLGDGSGADELNGRGLYEHLVLEDLQGFIINCERRARAERKIRKIRGLRESSSVPVVIGNEGVECNDDMELDDIYYIGRDDDGSGGLGL